MENINPSENLSTKAVYDYKLIKLALENGDQKAYAELMSRYRDSVYFMLMKMVNNKDDADDLTIEAFGKAFNRLKQYTPQFAFSTWLFKIASNNAIDFIRKKKNEQLHTGNRTIAAEDGGEYGFSFKSGDLDPEENFIKKQKIESLKLIVEKLKPKYRQLVEMRYYEELSYEEISEQLNLPIGTVKAQLFRARDFLFQVLKNTENKI
jgi:RNA polymerase sigma-70 factor (ECF subfamily)